VAHEKTDVHQAALQHHNGMAAAPGEHPLENPDNLPLSAFVADGVRSLLDSLAAPVGHFNEDPSDYTRPPSPQQPTLIDWGLSTSTELESSLEAQGIAQIAQQLSKYLDTDPVSDDEADERSDDEEEDLQEPTVAGASFLGVFKFCSYRPSS
jgi:hypothetical protein